MKNKNAKSKKGEKDTASPIRARHIIGALLALFTIFLLLSFVFYFKNAPTDQSLADVSFHDLEIGEEVSEGNGHWGVVLSHFFIDRCFGVASILLVYFFGCIAWTVLGLPLRRKGRHYVLPLLLMIWFSVFFASISSLFPALPFYLGGAQGVLISAVLKTAMGVWGEALVLLALLVLIVALISNGRISEAVARARERRRERAEARKEARIRAEEERVAAAEAARIANLREEENRRIRQQFEADINPEPEESVVENESVPETILPPEDEMPKSEESVVETVPDTVETIETETEETETETDTDTDPEFVVKEFETDDPVRQNKKNYDPTHSLKNYHYPTFDLLNDYGSEKSEVSEEEHETNKRIITDTFREFKIEITKIEATVGPTVTLYEIVPAPGVRISRIKALNNDIAMKLSALSTRIIAPIPGAGTIGIEVPNHNRRTVSMRGLLESSLYQNSKYSLPVAIGRCIDNSPFIFDLAEAPHLLVAGATGQGKSVGLNCLITSLLYKKHPSQVKLVLIDPKKVELSIYSRIEKHFLAKLPDLDEAIITDMDLVVPTLKSIFKEVQDRLELFKSVSVRNVREYNEKFLGNTIRGEEHRFLPYVVLIVDEFADLIMAKRKEVEGPITRIAQLSRAVGIHMVIATQRPSTDIITGVIKANFPARIAFRVAQMVDSRTILDAPGANHLIGKGDMLFSKGSDLVRIQCAFVDTPEVERIVAYIDHQPSFTHAYYLPKIEDENSGDGSSADANMDLSKKDELFDDVARMAVEASQCSTSSIQRRFSIGYNRAGRIMDQLEVAGIVGPQEGSRPRQVLVSDMYALEQLLNSLGEQL